MNTAERCFAEYGISAASIRTITGEARVNLGAVTYHFGSKENLIMAVFKRRMAPINQERVAMLAAAETEAGEASVSLRRIIEAIVVPQRRITKTHPEFLGFLVRMKNYPNPRFHKMIHTELKAVLKRFGNAIRAVLPPMPEPERLVRMALFIHLLEILPEDDFYLKQTIPDDLDRDWITEILISFVEGGLKHPLPSTASRRVSNRGSRRKSSKGKREP
jgi:AcrR family transcriptional regulator